MGEVIDVEVVFATPQNQCLLAMTIASGTSARRCILDSPLVGEFHDVDFESCQLGVWGRAIADDYVPVSGDRIEAYRPLPEDPREVRRKLAILGQSMGQAAAGESIKDQD